MSILFRLLRNSRPIKPHPTRGNMSNYFASSYGHYPFPGHHNLSLSRARLYSSRIPPGASQVSSNIAVLYSLMGVNAAIFGYAMYAKAQAQQGFPGPFSRFMRNFTCNLTDVVKNGAWWTMLTGIFTHIDIWHIGGNMFTTYYLGQFLCYSPYITPFRLLTIAIGSGVTGMAGFLYNRYLVARSTGLDYTRGLGFSGALMGITSVAACLNPSARVALYGIVPVPLWGLVAGYAFFDGYYVNDANSRVAHAGHLGGLAFGVAYYLLRLRGLRV